MKISNVLNNFLKSKQAEGITNATYKYYKSQIGFFIKYWGDNDITKFNIHTYENYILYLQNKYKDGSGFKGKSYKLQTISIKTYATAIRSLLNWAYQNKYIKFNIGKQIKMPKVVKKQIDILTDDDIHKLLNLFTDDTFANNRDVLIIVLMLDAGLRLSEVANLKLNDFNVNQNIIKVFGKGQKERFVPFTPFILKRYDLYLLSFKNQFKRNLEDNEHIFKTVDGNNITANTISKIFRRIRKKMNYNLHPHLLRHTFATHFLLNGGEIATLMIILGHTNIYMTEKYLHLASQLNLKQQAKYSPLSNF